LHLLARLLSRPPHRFAGFAGAPFRRLLVSAPPFQLTEESFALKSPLQDLEGLIDIVVANQNLQGMSFRGSLKMRERVQPARSSLLSEFGDVLKESSRADAQGRAKNEQQTYRRLLPLRQTDRPSALLARRLVVAGRCGLHRLRIAKVLRSRFLAALRILRLSRFLAFPNLSLGHVPLLPRYDAFFRRHI
jgi:hypothetical protein